MPSPEGADRLVPTHGERAAGPEPARPATSPATITLVLTACREQLEAELCDTGAAMEVSVGGAMPDELQGSGRGLALACAVTDELAYRRDGDVNRWRLSRRLRR